MKEKLAISYLSTNGAGTPNELTIPVGWELVDYKVVSTGGNGLGAYIVYRIREIEVKSER